MEDAALVRRTLEGDGEAFGALVARYQGAVYGCACHYLGDYAEAQDLAQDAFIEAYHRLGELRDPERFPAWLRGIALNFCRRYRRDQSRNAGSQPLETLADQGPTPSTSRTSTPKAAASPTGPAAITSPTSTSRPTRCSRSRALALLV